MTRRPLLGVFAALACCFASLAADDYADRLQYSPGGASGRFVPLGNLTIGGTETGTVCLCTDRNAPPGEANGEGCVDLAELCPTLGGANHSLPAALANGHQGYWYEGLKPALVVASGDTVDVEMVAAGVNAYDEQVVGDPELEALFEWGPNGPAIQTEGALGGGEGNHWLSGPIYVCDAEPGDVLQVDILDLKPRPNPGKGGRAFGWTGTPWWGYPWVAGFKTGEPREIVTVMEMELDENGDAVKVVPLYSFDFKALNLSTTCAPAAGAFPCTTAEGAANWTNTDRLYGNAERIYGKSAAKEYTVPCKDGTQRWQNLVYVGWNFTVPEELRDYSVKGAFNAPTRLHIGNMGLAPAIGVTATSAVPMRTGGNFDQRRLGKGATLYLPVEVVGALLSLGDGHGAMGDGEVSGTGLEASLNARLRVTLHKQSSLPPLLKGLDYPLVENEQEYVVNGFSFQDYLRELQDPQDTVGREATLDRAMLVAFNQTRDLLMGAFGLSEDAALAAISLGVDFGVTQLVDGNLGIHAVIPKSLVKPKNPPTSLVVGAGPAGILAAVHLARRGHQVHIFDKRPSPMEANASDERAFFIVLHPRGHRALLEAGIDLHAAAACADSGLQPVSALGIGSGRRLLQRRLPYSEPKLLGHRHAFIKAMVQGAQALQLPGLHWHWGTAFEGLGLDTKTATFSTGHGGSSSGSSGSNSASEGSSGRSIAPSTPGGSTTSLSSCCGSSGSGSEDGNSGSSGAGIELQYDLLIAADGGWSRVRCAAAQQAPELQATVQAARMRYKVVRGLPPSPACPFSSSGGSSGGRGSSSPTTAADEKEAVGLRMVVPATQPGIMFLSAAADGSGRVEAAVALSTPQAWDPIHCVEDHAAFLRKDFPALPPEWIPEMAAQLAAFPLAVAGMRVQASQLHAPGSVVLIGDAAHGVTPRTGNGLNAALEDAAVLSQLLDRHGADLAALPPAFTAARLADSEAILWLDDTASARAGSTALGRLHPHALTQGCAMLARSLLGAATGGRVGPAAMIAMNETCTPYSSVQAQMWRDAVLAVTAGLLLTLLLAVMACFGAVKDRLCGWRKAESSRR